MALPIETDTTSTAPGDILAKQNQALNELVSSLNQRQNPNWFLAAGALFNPGRTGSAGEALGNAATEVGRQQEALQQQAPNIAMIKAQLLGQQYQMGLKQQGMNLLSNIMGGGSPQEALKNLQTGNIPASIARLATPKQIVGLMSIDKDMGNALKTGYELQQTDMKNAIELLGKGVDIEKAIKDMSPDQQTEFRNNIGFYANKFGVPLTSPIKTQEKESTTTEPVSFNVTKSYGTPPQLLDNLEAVESSNDPYAVNKSSKAMGKHQFMPDTAAMLNKQGIKFNPFNEKESRAAADFYIQQLLKQYGGDYNKALAAYGGYNDPSKATGYVNKILNGVDLGKQQTSTENQPRPSTTPDFNRIGLVQRNDETKEAFEKRVADTEKGATKDYNELASGLRLVNVDSLKASNTELSELKQIADYKREDGTNPLFGTFQKRDLDNYATAATKVVGDLLAKGGNVSVGDVKYNVGLDLKPVYNNIKLTDSEKVMRSRAENIISSQIIANIIANKTKAFGGSRVTNYQDQQLSALNANIEQLPNYIKGWATRRQVDNAAMIKLADEFNKLERQAYDKNKPFDPRGFFTSDLYRKDLPNEHTKMMNDALKIFPFK
jgi:Transglycosylase SLT domain